MPPGRGPSTSIPRRYRGLVRSASQETGLPPKLIAAQIDDESGWDPTAVSPAGAEGIAQFEPGTWATWGHGSPDNPKDAFPAYAAYMGSLLKSYRGDIRDALAAYNAGPGNLQAGYGYADTILGAAGLGDTAHSSGQFEYKNPLRGVQNLAPERIDMGVDYGGEGPVYALGPGVITNTINAGWPGGAFISERLTQGPLAGHYTYVAEDVTPSVQVGQKVTADTQIGTLHGGLETGLAEPPGSGYALGRSQFTGSNATAFGQAYSKILHFLGAPPGTIAPGVQTTSASLIPPWLVGALAGIDRGFGGTGAGGAGLGKGLGDLGGLITALSDIAQAFTNIEQAIAWFFVPNHWVRIFCGVFGTWLVIGGILMMSRTGKASSVSVPGVGAVPYPGGEIAPAIGIAEVTIGAIFLFIAFHNLPSDVNDFPSLLSHLQQQVQGGGQS